MSNGTLKQNNDAAPGSVEEPVVEVKVENDIGVLVINRPTARNALNAQVVKELTAALDDWREDEQVRAVVITGAGDKSFAAGADIGELTGRVPTDALSSKLQRLLATIEEYEKPTVAAVNGYAFGGGCELAMACDIRLAAAHAKFGQPEVNLGIIPGAGGTQRLVRLIGRGRALDMILTGRAITAADAERYGLVTHVAEDRKVLDDALTLAGNLLAKGPLALRLAKLAVLAGADVDIKTGQLIERLAQGLAFGSADKAEGTSAFLEKRQAAFTGK